MRISNKNPILENCKFLILVIRKAGFHIVKAVFFRLRQALGTFVVYALNGTQKLCLMNNLKIHSVFNTHV